MLHSLVRQLIHFWRQSMRLLEEFLALLVFDTKHTIYELCLPSERGFGISMDLADPVSSGKYRGIFVFTAPVAERTVVSFTVPLNGCTIVATATVVTSCSSSADCPGSAAPLYCGGVCVAMSCGGGGFTPDSAYDSVWDSVRPMTGKYIIYYFQYQEDVGCVGMLNGWFSSIDVICADNHNYFQFKLKNKCRSGAATQVVDVHVVQLHRCSSWVDGMTFRGRVHRYTARGFFPAIRAGKGWRGRSLLPGVLPPN